MYVFSRAPAGKLPLTEDNLALAKKIRTDEARKRNKDEGDVRLSRKSWSDATQCITFERKLKRQYFAVPKAACPDLEGDKVVGPYLFRDWTRDQLPVGASPDIWLVKVSLRDQQPAALKKFLGVSNRGSRILASRLGV